MPSIDPERMRALVAAAPVARLATIDPDGQPNVVPFVFALDGDALRAVVDRKPKRTPALRRLENLRRDPRATVLVDRYDDDWSELWWVRLRGIAHIAESGPDLERTIELLRAKYPQYGDVAMDDIAIVIAIEQWKGWISAR
jgi:PPOX class probable F420-dependent enzyme